MAVKDVLKVNRKTFVNPRGWMGYDMLMSQFRITWSIMRDLFIPQEATLKETFAEAMQRLQLSEEDVQSSQQRYFIFAWFFAVIGVAAFLGAFYMAIHYHSFTAFVLGIATSALCLTYGFRYHFLYFQIKHRKLGCTFDEWLSGKVSDSGEPKP